jgi:hypothetical protein
MCASVLTLIGHIGLIISPSTSRETLDRCIWKQKFPCSLPGKQTLPCYFGLARDTAVGKTFNQNQVHSSRSGS